MARTEKRFDEAVSYFQAAIQDVTEEGPKLTAMNNLVRTYQENQKMEEGITQLREMLIFASQTDYKLRIGVQLVNVLLSQGKKDEAWSILMGIYNPKLPSGEMEGYYAAIIQAASPAKKIQQAFQFFDSIVASATNDESRSQASFYNGLLAGSTEPYIATGVTVLKRTYELFPKTTYGRWSPVEAAKLILSATSQFPNATEEAKVLFDQAVKAYDDIINDMTIEWFEPQRASWAWSQVGTVYEMRSQYLESIDDLKSASRTIGEIAKRFKALPQEVEMARRWQERVAYKLQIAETSPEFFWQQIRLARLGQLPMPEEEGAQPAGEVTSATPPQEAVPPPGDKSP
jgi:tetratricopeptide (TPR) repeat protein